MNHRAIGIAAAFVALAAAAGAVAARSVPPAWAKARLDALAPDGRAETITPAAVGAMARRFSHGAVFVAALGAGGWLARRRLARAIPVWGADLGARAASARAALGAWRTETGAHRLVLGLILLAALAARLAFLFQPMRHDEAFTYTQFASKPLYEALSRYAANNHLLNTLLAHVCAEVFGNRPWAIRLPAFLFGWAVVPAVYAVGRAFYGARAGLLAAALATSSSFLIDYATSARGYAMLAFLFLVQALLLRSLAARPGAGGWLPAGAVAALGLYAHPTAVLAWGFLAFWFLTLPSVRRRAHGPSGGEGGAWRGVALGAATAAILTALLYLPPYVASGLSILEDKGVAADPRQDLVPNLAFAARETAALWTRDLPAGCGPAIAAGFLGGLLLIREGPAAPWRFLAAGTALFAALFAVHPVVPAPRMVLFLLPVYLTVAAAGLARIGDVCLRRAGCHTVVIGIDSADFQMLAQYGRRLSRERLLTFLSDCRALGIDVCGDLILGFDEDTEESIRRTVAFALELDLAYVSINIATPLFGSSIRRRAQEAQRLAARADGFDTAGNTVLGNGRLGPERLKAFRHEANRAFYGRPSYLWRRLRAIRGPEHFLIQVLEASALAENYFRRVLGTNANYRPVEDAGWVRPSRVRIPSASAISPPHSA